METIARVNKLLITWARLNTVVLHFILPTGKFLLYSIEPWLIYHAVLWVVRLFMLCFGSFVVFESVICSVLNVVTSGCRWWAGRSQRVWCVCAGGHTSRDVVFILPAICIYAAIYLWYGQLLMYWFIYCFIIFQSHVDILLELKSLRHVLCYDIYTLMFVLWYLCWILLFSTSYYPQRKPACGPCTCPHSPRSGAGNICLSKEIHTEHSNNR